MADRSNLALYYNPKDQDKLDSIMECGYETEDDPGDSDFPFHHFRVGGTDYRVRHYCDIIGGGYEEMEKLEQEGIHFIGESAACPGAYEADVHVFLPGMDCKEEILGHIDAPRIPLRTSEKLRKEIDWIYRKLISCLV